MKAGSNVGSRVLTRTASTLDRSGRPWLLLALLLGLTLVACSAPGPLQTTPIDIPIETPGEIGGEPVDGEQPEEPVGEQPAPQEPDDPAARLRWAPPSGYQSYRVINVHTHDQLPSLDNGTDYLLVMPSSPRRRPLTISGGRNVVMIGGEIDLDVRAQSGAPESAHRGIYVTGGSVQGRVVHIEGLHIHSRSNTLSDGFHISRGSSGNHFVVQIQNVRVGPLPGPYFGGTRTHPDLIQTWGSVGELRIDRFTGISNYQGIFLKADYNGQHGPVHISRANVRGDRDGRYLLWMSNAGGAYPQVTLDEVWVQPSTGRSFGKSVWPDVDGAARLSSGEITWPSLPVTGSVRHGVPSGGDFVRADDVGIGYVSPGYR